MKKIKDWRYQVGLFGVNSSDGHPVESVEIAKNKYQSLVGRDLSISELRALEDIIRKLIAQKKLKK